MITYYELLGVSIDASHSSITAAFRKNIRIYHPDVNRAENADWITRALTDARTILSDAVQRAEYDNVLVRMQRPEKSVMAHASAEPSPFDRRDEERRQADARHAEQVARVEERRAAKRVQQAAREQAAEHAERERFERKRLAREAEQLAEQHRRDSVKRAAEAEQIERARLVWAEHQRKVDARLRESRLRTGAKIRHRHGADAALFGSVFTIVRVFQAHVQHPPAAGRTWQTMSVAVDAAFYIFVDSGRGVVTRSGSVEELNAIACETPELSELLAGKTSLY